MADLSFDRRRSWLWRPVGTYPNCCPPGTRYDGAKCVRPQQPTQTNLTPISSDRNKRRTRGRIGRPPACHCPAGTKWRCPKEGSSTPEQKERRHDRQIAPRQAELERARCGRFFCVRRSGRPTLFGWKQRAAGALGRGYRDFNRAQNFTEHLMSTATRIGTASLSPSSPLLR